MGLEFWIGLGLAILGIGLTVAKVEHRVAGLVISVIGVLVIGWAVISKRQQTSVPTSSVSTRAMAAPKILLTERPRPTRQPLMTPARKDTPVEPTVPSRAAVPEPTPISFVTYDYHGIRKITRGNVSYKEIGAEAEAYWRMWDLAKGGDDCHWMALRDFADSEMRKAPDWITPQVYLGLAYLHLGEVSTGDQLLESAIKRIGDNPDYAGMLPIIKPTPTDRLDQLTRMYSRPAPPPNGFPTPTPCPSY